MIYAEKKIARPSPNWSILFSKILYIYDVVDAVQLEFS